MCPPRLAIIVPCYKEQEVLPGTFGVLGKLLDSLVAEGCVSSDSYIFCVDDCSPDSTWQLVSDAHALAPGRVKGITLAHNAGQQNALLAGMAAVVGRCDCAVTIDADLQDDPEAIRTMLHKMKEGAEVVFGVRASRASDTWFKRTSARAFYRLQQMLGVETVYDHSEFRMLSQRAIRLVLEYGERNLFLRGIVVKIGLPRAIVTYDRAPRLAGETKYPLSKLVSLSVDGITSFSAKPIRMIFFVGLAFLILDFVVGVYALLSYFQGKAVTGWTSLILSVWFLGSLVLMSIGVVGEYIGKVFIEVKRRPRYAVREELDD